MDDPRIEEHRVTRGHVPTQDVVLFPTIATQTVVENHIDLDTRHTKVLHYGFDHEAFAAVPEDITSWSGPISKWKMNEYRLLLNVSTFSVQKNYETLVEALALLRQSGQKVKVLTTLSRKQTTDVAEFDALMRRVAELGVQDDFVNLGYVPYDQLGTLYRLSDVYVFPSFSESFGHSLVEAMAAGMPIVAADTPVNREVCGAAGVFFSAFDPHECARVLASMLDHTEQLEKHRAASHARASDFSWKGYTEQLVSLLHQSQSWRRSESQSTEEYPRH